MLVEPPEYSYWGFATRTRAVFDCVSRRLGCMAPLLQQGKRFPKPFVEQSTDFIYRYATLVMKSRTWLCLATMTEYLAFIAGLGAGCHIGARERKHGTETAAERHDTKDVFNHRCFDMQRYLDF